MPKLAANFTMMFGEVAFLERFGAAARAGFEAVEYRTPYEIGVEELAAGLEEHRLRQVLLTTPSGDWGNGERGFAAVAGREHEFRSGLELAIVYARRLHCDAVHVMAGNADKHDPATVERYVEHVQLAADAFAPLGIRALLEPINPIDMPGYFLHTTSQAKALIERIDRPNVMLQLDLYHTQVAEGDLERKIRILLPLIAHVQIAGNPARHEPDVGEVNYVYLLGVLDAVGYSGWVGCEYQPAGDTVGGLTWAAPYLTTTPRCGVTPPILE